jgi:hypothetical protein
VIYNNGSEEDLVNEALKFLKKEKLVSSEEK